MAMEDLSEEERRALRGSKFAPLPPSRSLSRLPHPGGPIKTNKAAALAKFLHRKLHQDPHGFSSIDPNILDLAVRNAKATLLSSGTSTIRHVDTFDDPEGSFDEGGAMNSDPKKQKKKDKKKKKKNNKNKRQKIVEDSECGIAKRPKEKKLKL
ncbi:uncharacterized protein LOC111009505 [Momordica charantia]|uniref:Uncharacterized protein LOC111009505 n=1 Tax=Momordica charantia TaxID=3673 RepID=A0A6J1CCM9_MOMCH|nr:uncharacterized protein LOC111009505 [Momordica charantia]